MRRIASLAACLYLVGCAGLDVTYDFHAVYVSEDLIAKRLAAEQKKIDATTAAQLP